MAARCRATERPPTASRAGCRRAPARLGVEVSFFAVPTAVFAAYRHNVEAHTVLLRTRDSAIDLQALDLLDETLLGRHARAQVRCARAGRGQAHHGQPPALPLVHARARLGLGAAAISVFLGGGARELTAAVPVGLAVGRSRVLARRMQSPRQLVELLAGLPGGRAHARARSRPAALPPCDRRAGRAHPAAARPHASRSASRSSPLAISCRARRGSPGRR